MAIGGSGTQADPWTISSPSDLVTFSTKTSYWASGTYAMLVEDIDMDGTSYTSTIGNTSTYYCGTFNGNNCAISNLTKTGSSKYVGLFGVIGNSIVKNIGCENFKISGYWGVGGLCGRITNGGNVSNCYVSNSTLSASSTPMGGLSADMYSSASISNCYTYNCTSSIRSGDSGGIVGYCGGSRILNCATYGGTKSNLIAGNNSGSTISNCYTSNDVSSSTFHSKGFWDGTQGKLSWDFTTPVWYWDSEKLLPVLTKTSINVPVKIDGEWTNGIPYVKVNGEWKEASKLYVEVNGEWKEQA